MSYTKKDISRKITLLSDWKQSGSVGEFVRRISHSTALENVGGSICGVKIENIRRPDMKTVRRLDKLVGRTGQRQKCGKDNKRIKKDGHGRPFLLFIVSFTEQTV